jgi:arylsulfatase A-like enzyme
MLSFAQVLLGALLACAAIATSLAAERPPNVILVMTDDQGYGDLGCHGNKTVRTPNIDRLHAESVRLTDFHVDPVCAPTRAALLTGRYSTRTGVWATVMGRSLMRPDEVTIAEVLRDAGYRTGIFGKWHLGESYPLRPQDQGFDKVIVHGAGGIGQTPDYWGNDYFDDTYSHNGKPQKYTGYCTDVFFNEALGFIEKTRDHPFFVYLSTNAPHGPFFVPEKYSQAYRERGVPPHLDLFYGMITNIDDNMGRLMRRLREWDLETNTILIFMTDNGTPLGHLLRDREKSSWTLFNAGMRGQKSSAYEGGHRVPFFVRWPGGTIGGGRDVAALTSHIDVLPTLAELCGATIPSDVNLDGKSLVPLLKETSTSAFERTLFVHSQRIEIPEKWRECAVMTTRWRLINGEELYDVQVDRAQDRDVATQHPEVVARLRAEYERWWTDLSDRFDEFVPITVGSEHENPVRITGHDWHSPEDQVPYHQALVRRGVEGNGFWVIDVARHGRYAFALRRWPREVSKPMEATHARLRVGQHDVVRIVPPESEEATFELQLEEGTTRMQTWLTHQDSGRERGAYFVVITRR